MTHEAVSSPTTPTAAAPVSGERPLIELRGISKLFGHVQALQRVDFCVYPAEVIGLLRPASRLALKSGCSYWNYTDRVDSRYCF